MSSKTYLSNGTRPALFGLLAATAVLYLWGLGASGWANSFYSAAAQAGSQSWKAWFFGSSDAANAWPLLFFWIGIISPRRRTRDLSS